MRTRLLAVLVLVLVAGGCRQLLGIDDPVVGDAAVAGDAPADAAPLVTEDGWASGSRLKLAWNDYRGVRADLTMFDSELGVRCVAYAWADGKHYCAPFNFTAPFEGVGYTDDQCTQAVGYRVANECSAASLPEYLTQARKDPCVLGQVRTKVFRRGDPRVIPTTLYVNEAGTCEASGYPPSIYLYYNLEEEIPVTSLVELTETRVTLDDRLDRIDYRGADGSSYAGPAYDRRLDAQCSLNEAGTCAPAIGASRSAFGDSSCTDVLASVERDCPAPKFGTRAVQPGCSQTTNRYFAVGERSAISPVYQFNGMTCAQATVSPTSDYYMAPTEVTQASLARSVDAPPQGSAIALVHFGTGTERSRATGAYDYTHATRCVTLGGRCLPGTGATGTATYFTDAGCLTQRTFALHSATVSGCTAPTLPPYFVVLTQDQCTATYEVHEPGARYTGPLYTGTPAACTPASSSFDLYELGGVVPQVEFAVATPMMDP